MPQRQRDTRRADRTRAAICIALADADHASLSIGELVLAVERSGIPLGDRPNKTVADAIRWELSRGHVRRTGRGRYAIGRIPRSTLHYMRVRVRLYGLDPTRGYDRPHHSTPIYEVRPPASRLAELLTDWDLKRRQS